MCPKCGHEWKYRGNNYRTKCVNCRKNGIITIIKTGFPYKKVGTVGTSNGTAGTHGIKDNIIFSALSKSGVNPLKPINIGNITINIGLQLYISNGNGGFLIEGY